MMLQDFVANRIVRDLGGWTSEEVGMIWFLGLMLGASSEVIVPEDADRILNQILSSLEEPRVRELEAKIRQAFIRMAEGRLE